MPARLPPHEIGIVVALPAEARSLGIVRWRPGAWTHCPAGCVAMAGVGHERATVAARQLLDQGMRVLLSWGVAGALVPSLRPGDVLLPDRVVAACGEWSVDNALRARLATALHTSDGDAPVRLWCGDAPVAHSGDKRDLARRNLHAVDMESAAVASVATDAGAAFAVVKAICDPAARVLPAAASALLRGDGRLCVRGLLDAAVGGPAVWRQLNQLRHDFEAAHHALRRAARQLSMEGWT